MIIEIYYYTQKKTPTAFLGQLVFFCVINITLAVQNAPCINSSSFGGGWEEAKK